MVAKPAASTSDLACLDTFDAEPPSGAKRPKTTMTEEYNKMKERLETVERENAALRAEVGSLKLHLKELMDAAPAHEAAVKATSDGVEELAARTKTDVSNLYAKTNALETQAATLQTELRSWASTEGAGSIRDDVVNGFRNVDTRILGLEAKIGELHRLVTDRPTQEHAHQNPGPIPPQNPDLVPPTVPPPVPPTHDTEHQFRASADPRPAAHDFQRPLHDPDPRPAAHDFQRPPHDPDPRPAAYDFHRPLHDPRLRSHASRPAPHEPRHVPQDSRYPFHAPPPASRFDFQPDPNTHSFGCPGSARQDFQNRPKKICDEKVRMDGIEKITRAAQVHSQPSE